MAINKRIIRSNDEAAGAASFNTVTYTGTGANQQVTGVGFEPDFVWIKNRDTTNTHTLHDTIRGIGNQLASNTAGAEQDETAYFTGVGDGFLQFGLVGGNYTTIGQDYVAWCWKAGGAAVTNNDGTITSQVSANTEAGFSIVSYTGNGVAATVGHGLDTPPSMYIVKPRTAVAGAGDWQVYNSNLGGNDKILLLNSTSGTITVPVPQIWNNTSPTNTVFSLGTNTGQNNNGTPFIAYCFAEVAGFSKFGSYTGGTLNKQVDCEFEPAFVMLKNTTNAASWAMFDNKRGVSGGNDAYLAANLSDAEADVGARIEFNATGFELTTTNANYNAASNTYIFMAFANQF